MYACRASRNRRLRPLAHQSEAAARAGHWASYVGPPTSPALKAARIAPGEGRASGSALAAGSHSRERTIARAHWK